MTRRARRLRTGGAAAALAIGLLASACGQERVRLDDPDLTAPEPSTPVPFAIPADPVVLLRMATSGDPIVQAGSAAVEIGTVTLDGGRVTVSEGRSGAAALDFPPFAAEGADYPRAVVSVTNTGPGDPMSPGDRDFAWGADFRVDAESTGQSVDNGDNLVQRGTSGYPEFFKAEVDDDRAACTVTGSEGTLTVRASEQVRPGSWYRLRCERRGPELAVHVTEFSPDGTHRSYASRVQGAIGTVTYAEPFTPLSVGGKIGADGELIASATDQFNGLVMNPFFAYLDGDTEAAG